MANDIGATLQKEVKQSMDYLIRKYTAKYRKAAEQAAKNVRRSITRKWFGQYDSININGSLRSKSNTTNIDNKQALIEVTTWIDVDKYAANKKRIMKWDEKYNVWNSSIVAAEYVLNLQLERGIIGLPAKGSRKHVIGEDGKMTYWENPNFIKRSVGLLNAIENAPEWNNGTFLKEIERLL